MIGITSNSATASGNEGRGPSPNLPAEVQEHAVVLLNLNLTPDSRVDAVKALARLGDSAAIRPLILGLSGSDKVLRTVITKALVHLNGVRVLTEQLKHNNAAVRADAAQSLGVLRLPRAEPILIKTLADKNARVREQAAGALALMGSAKSADALIKRLKTDPSGDVRGAAAQALGRIDVSAGWAALRAALESEKDGFVKVLIRTTLQGQPQ